MTEDLYFSTNGLKLTKVNKSYFKNDIELVMRTELSTRPYTSEEFVVETNHAVSEFIDKSFDHIIFLIGAGGSVIVNKDGSVNAEYGKTVAMIAQQVYETLEHGTMIVKRWDGIADATSVAEKQVFTLEEMSKKIGYMDNIFVPSQSPRKVSNDFNLENFLSRLITYSEFAGKDKEKWQDSKDAIFDIIQDQTEYEFDNSVFKHTKLINLLSKRLASENKLSIVTTNYDTLIEDAAETMGYTVFDGFSFSRTPRFDEDMFEWHLSKPVSNMQTRQNVYKKQVFDLLKIHGSLTWRQSQSGNHVVRLNKHAPGRPVMIFPSSDKYMHSYEEPYFELFSRFQELLKQPNTLFVTSGFSFADNHISRMIIQAIKHNTSLYTLISDYSISPSVPNKNWKELEEMSQDAYSIALLRASLNGELSQYLGDLR
ncbi:SIR2 family protein [Lacticaseibacillus paracasei]|uniref:SIR2 family protein n=1 Tax=Lacticaseibacillus paracasei TaxID=1597 RepID=UPI000FEE6B75|nr:SIR2 family protein [Lacticaseibacillus paracasei]RWZ62695.1 SIR2 family protein [Lacticaseibacillus paracasei]